jgi:TolB-like protein/DNA-binding winged helix-turn-helix (wHTH) protein/tetratricopeptide (TPR) repeat protein
MNDARLLGFGPFVLDVAQRVLLRGGEPLRLAPRDIDLLIVLVRQAGRIVEKDELLATIWAGRVVEEGNIARHVTTLRHALGDPTDAPRYIATVPKRGYRFVAPVTIVDGGSRQRAASASAAALSPVAAGSVPRGLVPVSSVSLATEESPGGGLLVGNAESSSPGAHSRYGPSKALWVAVLAGVSAFGLLVWWYWTGGMLWPPGIGTDSIDSLAVLPLTNLSGDPAKEYLADAMTEALLTDLAQIRALHVISRTSVMSYKDARESVPEIARKLHVDGVVEGGVMVAGERVRITAQLIDGRTDQHIWAQSFEGDLRDVLGLQRRVSRRIAEQINVKLRPEEAARLAHDPGVDPEVFDAYARARYFWNKRTSEDILRSIAAFRETTELGPAYAPAFAGLADAYGLAAEYRALSPAESLPLAEIAARRAVELDPDSAEAHASLASVLQTLWQWSAAEREFQRAIELNPGYGPAHEYYGEYLTLLNRHDEAIEQQRLAHELDPVSLIGNAVLGVTYYYAAQYRQAARQLNATLALDPNFAVAHEMLGRAYDALGEHDQAVAHFQRAVAISGRSPEYLAALGRSYALHDDEPRARALLAELETLATVRYVSNYEFAMVHGALGERDRAFEYLEAAFKEQATWMPFLAVSDGLPELRGDPRYADLVRRMALPD